MEPTFLKLLPRVLRRLPRLILDWRDERDKAAALSRHWLRLDDRNVSR